MWSASVILVLGVWLPKDVDSQDLPPDVLAGVLDELALAGYDYGLEASEGDLLELLSDPKEIADNNEEKEEINELKDSGIPDIPGLEKDNDGALYYKGEKVKKITEISDEEAKEDVNISEAIDIGYQKDVIEGITPVKSLTSLKDIQEVKSIKPVKSIKEVKSMKPIESIQEVLSMQEVKSIQEVPEEIARRFIKMKGLLPRGAAGLSAIQDAPMEGGSTQDLTQLDVMKILKEELEKCLQNYAREKSMLDKLTKITDAHRKKLEAEKQIMDTIKELIEDLPRATKEGELANTIDALNNELAIRKTEVATAESIPELESESINRDMDMAAGSALMNPLENMDKIKTIIPVESIMEVKAKQDVQSILPLSKVDRVKSINDVKSIKPVNKVQKVNEMKEVTKVQQVKGLYELTEEQANLLRRLNMKG